MTFRRIAALSLVAASGFSLMPAGVGASETKVVRRTMVVASTVVAPAFPLDGGTAAERSGTAADVANGPAVVDVTVAPNGAASDPANGAAASDPGTEGASPATAAGTASESRGGASRADGASRVGNAVGTDAVVDVTVAPNSDASDPANATTAGGVPAGAASGGSATSAGSAGSTVAQAPVSSSGGGAMLDFGNAPSGVVPILFNDHHIYAKPDELRRGRLLAALVKNGNIMVPLRSLFQALGATVSYDPQTREILLQRRGSDVSLTVGKPEITIDGETRPLDVPPEISNGIVLVPVRVCSEVFGAYVQYVPQLRVVAIRFIAPTAPPPAPIIPRPPAMATAPPVSGPRRIVPPGPPVPALPPGLETIIVVDTVISPQVSNEFADGAHGSAGQNLAFRAATEFDFLGAGFEIDGSYRQIQYDHPNNFVNAIGGGSTFVPAFVATEDQLDAHVGVRLSPEKVYLVFGYASQTTRYGYPRVGGLGLGLTKLPALDRPLSIEGSIVYYPNLSGQCTNTITCRSAPETLAYSEYRYYGGLTYAFAPHVFIEAGYIGDRRYVKAGFPANGVDGGPFAGLGARF